MAILSAKILKHQKRADGTYNVKICIAHKDEKSYIDTPHVVTEKQIRKDLSIKDNFIVACVNKSMDGYRRAISDLDDKLDQYSAKTLKQYFLKKEEKVDFFVFCQLHIDLLDKEGRCKSKANFKTVRNQLIAINKLLRNVRFRYSRCAVMDNANRDYQQKHIYRF